MSDSNLPVVPELPVLGLGKDAVGELDDRTLRTIAECDDARPVGDVDLGLDTRDCGGVHHDRRDIDGFAHRASSPQGFIPAGNMVPRQRSGKISVAREQIDDVSRILIC